MYGRIKINETISCLPPRRQEQYYRLQKIKRKNRTAAQQTRMEELWEQASQLHKPLHLLRACPDCPCPQCASRRDRGEEKPSEVEPWFEELKATMWAKHNAEQS